jgi:diguanylate cyclase (GGDEF)-like protein
MEPSEAAAQDYAAFWRTLRSGIFLSGRYKRIGRDGQKIWLQASYNPIFDLNGKLDRIMKFAIDITADVAMAEAFEDAKRQAHHDPATALPNRTRLASFLSTHLIDPHARLAVMYLDLDRFKAINDTHGPPVGDKVLGEVADRLRRSLKPDQIAARIGGDEFVIAAPHLSEEDVATHCNHLLPKPSLSRSDTKAMSSASASPSVWRWRPPTAPVLTSCCARPTQRSTALNTMGAGCTASIQRASTISCKRVNN